METDKCSHSEFKDDRHVWTRIASSDNGDWWFSRCSRCGIIRVQRMRPSYKIATAYLMPEAFVLDVLEPLT
jgi:hypothetical protein